MLEMRRAWRCRRRPVPGKGIQAGADTCGIRISTMPDPIHEADHAMTIRTDPVEQPTRFITRRDAAVIRE
jgi:hypothetical protein